MYEELLDGDGTSLSFGEYYDRMQARDSVKKVVHKSESKNESESR